MIICEGKEKSAERDGTKDTYGRKIKSLIISNDLNAVMSKVLSESWKSSSSLLWHNSPLPPVMFSFHITGANGANSYFIF